MPYLTGVGKLAGEKDDLGVLPAIVCNILLLDSGVVCSLLMDVWQAKTQNKSAHNMPKSSVTMQFNTANSQQPCLQPK